MRPIEIIVKDKIAINPDPDAQVIVCGNSDYVINFNFDAEWGEYDAKTARFTWDGRYRDVVFTGGSCPVPVVSKTHHVNVGVFAGDLRTTTPALIYTRKSILCDGGIEVAPSEDVYAQIMDMINAGMLRGPEGATSYLHAEVEDGCLVIYGGEKDDIRFSINDAGELEATYAEV